MLEKIVVELNPDIFVNIPLYFYVGPSLDMELILKGRLSILVGEIGVLRHMWQRCGIYY